MREDMRCKNCGYHVIRRISKIRATQGKLTVVTCCKEIHISLGSIDLLTIVNNFLKPVDYLLILNIFTRVESNAFGIIANTIIVRY